MHAGDQLGPYKIIEQLGAGGMGEVYLGEDTRLGRKVAIKVLPAEFASDPERLARFEQEARAAAALNHPHIAVVHDIGFEQGAAGDSTEAQTDLDMAAGASAVGVHYIVQEFLEGEALDALLTQGALSLKKATTLGAEVAEALAAAHKAGIVHRDLKPANIFITAQGHAKVLDFGLAKLTEVAGKGDMSMSPTMLGTMAGQVMGTAGYMAPEQVEGKAVDHRADMFAFGCVLYEAVVGGKAFAGQSVPDTLSKILHDEPLELVHATGKMPEDLARITRKCLAKEPESRYQHAEDLVVDLRAGSSGPVTGPATAQHATGAPGAAAADTFAGATAPARPSATVAIVPWVVAAVAVVVALASYALRSQESAVGEVVRFSIERGRLEVQNTQVPPFAVSPDGRTVVYLAMGDAGEQLFRRRIDELEATALPGSIGGRAPFFSPDGARVAFFAEGELRKVALSGGPARTICSVQSTNAAGVWTADNEIIFALQAVNVGLLRVSADGGEPAPLTTLDLEAGETEHRAPRILPGGRRVVFEVIESGSGRIGAVSLDTGDRIPASLPRGAYHAGSGHFLSVEAQQLLAVPVDLDNLAVTGPPITLLEGVTGMHAAGGTLVYAVGADPGTGLQIVRVDRTGQTEELPGLPGSDYALPDLSPDGNLLAFTEGSSALTEEATIGVYEVQRGATNRRVVPGFGARWRADSRSIAYGAGQLALAWRPLDGSREAEEVASVTEGSLWTTDVSPDGRFVAYYVIHPDTGRDIWTVDMESDEGAQPFLVTAASERSAVFSPDGEWIAYMSDSSGREEIYVRAFPAGGAEIKVSIDGGREPRWAADGSEIFFRRDDGMYAVPVTKEPQFSAGLPDLLFQGRFAAQAGGRNANYDVDAEGNFYIVLAPPGGEQVNVVLNWDQELERVLAGQR